MALSNLSNEQSLHGEPLLPDKQHISNFANVTAVSWGAIFAGALAAAVLTLILLLLGAGLGLSSISPWTQKGISASTFGLSTIIWLTATQVIASGMGGYFAGRLRVRWVNTQADEVYFRDTAHGFLAWSIATLATAIMISSFVGSILNSGVQTVTNLTGVAASAVVAGGVAAAGDERVESNNASAVGAIGYVVDALFRKDPTMASASPSEEDTNAPNANQPSAPRSEVMRILMNALRMKTMPPADLSYIGHLVSKQTGMTQLEAEKRVTDLYAAMQTNARNAEIAAKDAVDKARKASIYSTLWLFVSLLMGAFSASLAATWGGRCRDA